MADNLAVTPGSGASVATDDVSSVHYQKVKLDVGGDGATPPVSATANAVPVKSLDDVITLDASVDTDALADNDVAFATQELAGVASGEGACAILQSIVIDCQNR